MGFIKPTAGKGGRAKILPPSFRRAFSGSDQIKIKRFIVREVILFPLSMALLIATVSPEPVPLTNPDSAVIWPKSLCYSGWCNCTRINEVPSTAELAAVSYGRRGFNQVDVLQPVVIKDGLRIQCYCTKRQDMQIDHASLPQETVEVEVVGCGDVSFSQGSLSRPISLASIHIRSSKKISFRRNLYVPQIVSPSVRPPDALRSNPASIFFPTSRSLRTARPPYGIPPPTQTLLQVSESQSFSVETGAFRTIPTVAPPSIGDGAAAAVSLRPRPPLSVRLDRVGHVLVEGASFGRLSSFAASEVRRMEMRENAFSAESAPDVLASLDGSSKNGATLTTQVSFRDVTIPWIPRHAFPSSATEVTLKSSEVNAIRRDAFSALTFSGITLMESVIEDIESGAFSGRTLCQRLTLHRVRIRSLYRNAFRAAINKFSVSHSWIKQVGSGAFNLTVASASITDNVFENVRSRGFSLRDWDRVILRNNTFLRLESGSFSGLVVSDSGPDFEGQDDSSASSSSSTVLEVYSLKQLLNPVEPQIGPMDDLASAVRRFPRFASRYRELNITENVFGDTPGGSLSLLPLTDHLGSREDELENIAMVVSDNRFRHGCNCGMTIWLKSLTKDSDLDEEDMPSPRSWSRFLYNTSMCLVDSDLARCFNVSVGFMRMKDFAFIVCPEDENAEAALPCDAEEENPAVHKAVVVVVVPDTAAGAGGADLSGGGELGDGGDVDSELEHNKKILHTILGTVVVCILIILVVTFVRRTRWWKRVRERSVSGEEGTCWAIAGVLLAMRVSSTLRRSQATGGGKDDEDGEGISGADSITRLSVDGYNEMIEGNTIGRKTGTLEGMLLVDEYEEEEEAEEEEVVSDADDIEREDKATQTMPEELTHELLEALREKLDDPENYSEARDMIEHLYDIIKVEEEREMEEMKRRRERSVATDDDEDDDENLYDVIGPRPSGRRRRRRGGEAAASCNSVGTRVPSPDKLEPVLTASASLASLASIASIVSPLGSPMPPRGGGGGARKRRPAPKAPAVCEYVEPKDRAQHLYTELPSNGTPEASDPRPPRLRMNDEQKEDPSRVEAPDPPPPPSVPLKFLRALGETFLTSSKPPRAPPPQKTEAAKVKSNGGILCEYTEPTDAKVHVYTELPPLPPSSSGNSPSHNHQLPVSMANRPLPHKPDSPGEGPSSAFVSR